MGNAVMEGIRILEVAEHTFVPAASAILAEWGADVIKVEHAQRGDAMRGLQQVGTHGFEASIPVLFESSNRGKRSIGLDLNDPDGLDVLYALAARSDVFLTNKLPSVAKRLKIEVEDIRRHNRDIVYVRGSGYGARGPDADAGGYDFLGYWARSGVAENLRSGGDRPPYPPAPAYGDNIGAMTIAGGIAAALLHRERTGEPDVVDVSLLGSAMWAMNGAIAISHLTGEPYQPVQRDAYGTPSNPLVGLYETKDHRYVALAMLQGFHYWPDMCERLGLTHLLDDARFSSAELLMANAQEAGRLVADVFASRTQAEWAERLTGMRGQWCLVQDVVEIGSDPQVEANGYFQDVQLQDGRPFKLVASPVQYGETPAPVRRAPEFNEHGDQILTEDLGLDWDRVVELKLKGAVT